METINVTFDLERSKSIFRRYFSFERKRAFKNAPVLPILATSFAFMLIGIYADSNIFWGLGIFLDVFFVLYLLVFYVRFEISYKKFCVTLEQQAGTSNLDFQFSFDSSSLKYTSSLENYDVKWNAIKSYFENGDDVYLYKENQEFFDIISSSIIGHQAFNSFKEILKEKLQKSANNH